MEQKEAQRLAEILRTAGYDAVAERSGRMHDSAWMVRPERALVGWTKQENMPYYWRRAVERAEAKVRQTETPSGGMTKDTAERYAAVLRERGVHEAGAIPDISEGNDGNWGVSDGDRHYWEYGQFPEIWKQAICAPDRAPALPEVTVTLDRTSAALAVGELLVLVRAFEPLDGQYAARLQQVCDQVVMALAQKA